MTCDLRADHKRIVCISHSRVPHTSTPQSGTEAICTSVHALHYVDDDVCVSVYRYACVSVYVSVC